MPILDPRTFVQGTHVGCPYGLYVRPLIAICSQINMLPIKNVGELYLFDWGLTSYSRVFHLYDDVPAQWVKETTLDTTGNKQRQDGTNTGRNTDTTNRSASCSPLALIAPGQHEAPSNHPLENYTDFNKTSVIIIFCIYLCMYDFSPLWHTQKKNVNHFRSFVMFILTHKCIFVLTITSGL